MKREKEFNEYITEQINSQEINNTSNKIAISEISNNIEKIKLLKEEIELYNKGLKLRRSDNKIITKRINDFKELVRNGEYGNEYMVMNIS